MNDALYGRTYIYNWSPYMLKAYLKSVNEHLLAKEPHGPFTEEEDEIALQPMKRDTLYIPDYVNLKFDPFLHGEKTVETDYGSVHDFYPYHVKVISKEELGRIVKESSTPVYYLVFIKSSSDKYINVFEAHSGKLLFARYSPASFNFKYKDLKDLYKTMR